MPHNKIAPVLFGTMLAASLAPASAIAADDHAAAAAAPVATHDASEGTHTLETSVEDLVSNSIEAERTESAAAASRPNAPSLPP